MNRRTTPSAWMTPTNLSLARTLWDEGMATTEIARRVGTTKNGLLGYAHRHNWPPRPSPIGVRKGEVWQARAPAPRKPEQPHRSRNAPPTRKRPLREVVPGRRETCKPEPLGVPTAAFGGCQWIDGADRKTWKMCGRETVLGTAWCPHHKAICYSRSPRQEMMAA